MQREKLYNLQSKAYLNCAPSAFKKSTQLKYVLLYRL